jgi:hypothetical protein
MKSSKKPVSIVAFLACCLVPSVPQVVSAQEMDNPIAACLKAWGDHPFGKNPQFKTLEASVKVFGIGKTIADTESTSSPSLVLINPIVNVMGGSTVDLMNPNGWYCMRTTVTIVGGVNIRAHCKAQLAASSDGKAMLSDKTENRGIKNLNVTVMGSVSIERPCS